MCNNLIKSFQAANVNGFHSVNTPIKKLTPNKLQSKIINKLSKGLKPKQIKKRLNCTAKVIKTTKLLYC